MEELIKKIQMLNTKLKQGGKPLKTPGAPSPEKMPKEPITNIKGPGSKKDPVKVAEQMTDIDKLKQPDTKKQAKKNRETLSYNKAGQWTMRDQYITKSDDFNHLMDKVRNPLNEMAFYLAEHSANQLPRNPNHTDEEHYDKVIEPHFMNKLTEYHNMSPTELVKLHERTFKQKN